MNQQMLKINEQCLRFILAQRLSEIEILILKSLIILQLTAEEFNESLFDSEPYQNPQSWLSNVAKTLDEYLLEFKEIQELLTHLETPIVA